MKYTFHIFTLVALLMATTINTSAQTWDTGGNFIIGTEWFGADNSSTIPIRFQHGANDAVSRFEWYTTAGTTLQERMRLTRIGFLGLNTTAPLMRLHVNNGGVLATGSTGANPNLGAGRRMMWIPHQWAFRAGSVLDDEWDYPNVGDGSAAFGTNNTARLQNDFAAGVNNYVSSTNGAAIGQNNSVTGTTSFSFGLQNNVSSSNSFATGKDIDLSGNISAAIGCFIESSGQYNLTLGRGSDGMNRLINTIDDCLMVGFNSDIPTFYVGPSLGPGKTGNVGVGTTTPVAKFHVDSETGENTGINVTVVHNDQNITGIMSDASGGQFGYGGQFRGTGSTASYGVLATGTTGSDRGYGVAATGNGTLRGVGVMGSSSEGEISVGVAGISNGGDLSIGLYGEGNDHAAYFAGSYVSSQPALNLSDEKFKMNVEEINCGLECLAQLNPVSYDFKTEEFPHMHFSDGRQYGLIAQEVNEVLPDIVHTVKKPEMIDPESGEVISEGEENLAIQYGALIPILISSVQEQQAMIEAQQEQINLLSSMVTDCCSGDAKSLNHPPVGENNSAYELDVKLPSLQQNAPNPFSESTMIRYSLPEPAAMRLRVHNQNGQLIEVLSEGNMPAGDYNIRWDGSHLTPGVYLYILEVDGVELVKRAVKVN